MRKINCLRCQKPMNFCGEKKIQLGEYGYFLGHLSNLVAGALEVDFFACPQCGKLEFFAPEDQMDVLTSQEEEQDVPPEIGRDIVGVSSNGMPQVRCPRCGKEHDFDYPKCIFCGYDHQR